MVSFASFFSVLTLSVLVVQGLPMDSQNVDRMVKSQLMVAPLRPGGPETVSPSQAAPTDKNPTSPTGGNAKTGTTFGEILGEIIGNQGGINAPLLSQPNPLTPQPQSGSSLTH